MYTSCVWQMGSSRKVAGKRNVTLPLTSVSRYCISVSTHSLRYSIGEYDISVCVSLPIPIRVRITQINLTFPTIFPSKSGYVLYKSAYYN